MTIEQMKCFIMVAELLNFTEAAKRLYSSQQVVSRQIANVERELGFRLFERTTKHVALTPRGKDLFPVWKESVQKIDASVEAAKAKAAKKKNTLRVGVVNTHKTVSFIKRVFMEFLDADGGKNRKYVLEHHTLSAGRLTDLLIWNDIDLIFVLSSELAALSESNRRGIETHVLLALDEYIVFSKKHPFAHKSKITPKDLSNAVLLLPSNEFSHVSEHYIMNALKARKAVPKEILYFDTIDNLEFALYSGEAFALTPEVFFENADANLIFRRFKMPEGEEEALVAAWSKKNKSRRIVEFVEYLSKKNNSRNLITSH